MAAAPPVPIRPPGFEMSASEGAEGQIGVNLKRFF